MGLAEAENGQEESWQVNERAVHPIRMQLQGMEEAQA